MRPGHTIALGFTAVLLITAPAAERRDHAKT
jgi:hypothetical protein